MAPTVNDFAVYLKQSRNATTDSAFYTAVELVSKYLGVEHLSDSLIPSAIVDRAVFETGAALFRRDKALGSGGQQLASPDGSPVMFSRDPMVTVYPMLNRYIGGGFS